MTGERTGPVKGLYDFRRRPERIKAAPAHEIPRWKVLAARLLIRPCLRVVALNSFSAIALAACQAGRNCLRQANLQPTMNAAIHRSPARSARGLSNAAVRATFKSFAPLRRD